MLHLIERESFPVLGLTSKTSTLNIADLLAMEIDIRSQYVEETRRGFVYVKYISPHLPKGDRSSRVYLKVSKHQYWTRRRLLKNVFRSVDWLRVSDGTGGMKMHAIW